MTRLGTVSYLNARPLIDGLETDRDLALVRCVPSRLLDTLETGETDIALCPIIDFQRSSHALEVVPSGAIGCHGPALTVRLFSRRPLHEIGEIAVDGESHTSVALVQIVLHSAFGIRPALRPWRPEPPPEVSDAILLIGDKVITAAPSLSRYPHQLDLGQAWRELAGLPFVFATWMTPAGTELGDLPDRLQILRQANAGRLGEIAHRHAEACGWPPDLAVSYLNRNLRYDFGPAELEGVREFWRRCRELGVIDDLRPLALYAPRAHT